MATCAVAAKYAKKAKYVQLQKMCKVKYLQRTPTSEAETAHAVYARERTALHRPLLPSSLTTRARPSSRKPRKRLVAQCLENLVPARVTDPALVRLQMPPEHVLSLRRAPRTECLGLASIGIARFHRLPVPRANMRELSAFFGAAETLVEFGAGEAVEVEGAARGRRCGKCGLGRGGSRGGGWRWSGGRR